SDHHRRRAEHPATPHGDALSPPPRILSSGPQQSRLRSLRHPATRRAIRGSTGYLPRPGCGASYGLRGVLDHDSPDLVKQGLLPGLLLAQKKRSEERRVGKECIDGWWGEYCRERMKIKVGWLRSIDEVM